MNVQFAVTSLSVPSSDLSVSNCQSICDRHNHKISTTTKIVCGCVLASFLTRASSNKQIKCHFIPTARVEIKWLSCKILPDSARILQEYAYSCKISARILQDNHFLSESYKIAIFSARILQDSHFFSARILQDSPFLNYVLDLKNALNPLLSP